MGEEEAFVTRAFLQDRSVVFDASWTFLISSSPGFDSDKTKRADLVGHDMARPGKSNASLYACVGVAMNYSTFFDQK